MPPGTITSLSVLPSASDAGVVKVTPLFWVAALFSMNSCALAKSFRASAGRRCTALSITCMLPWFGAVGSPKP